MFASMGDFFDFCARVFVVEQQAQLSWTLGLAALSSESFNE